MLLADNADRPYGAARRDALRQLLGDDFAPEAAAARVERVELNSRQGDAFDIALERWERRR